MRETIHDEDTQTVTSNGTQLAVMPVTPMMAMLLRDIISDGIRSDLSKDEAREGPKNSREQNCKIARPENDGR